MIAFSCTEGFVSVGRTNEESELIAGIQAGEDGAFEKLVRVHGAQMLSVSRRFMRCEQDAHDALQDALVCVFRKANTFAENSTLSTWLHRITVNACLMRLRSQRRRNEVEIEDRMPTFDETGHHSHRVAAWDEGPAAHAEVAEIQQRVRECIDQLPERYRTVLLLRDIEQMDTGEAAEVLGCTENCVKTRLHRARMALRSLLEPMFVRQVA